jgi:hypothetical protein
MAKAKRAGNAVAKMVTGTLVKSPIGFQKVRARRQGMGFAS